MRVPTSRDIRSGLELARKRKAASITQMIEDQVKAEIEKEFGPILSDETAAQVATRQLRTMMKQRESLKKSKLKILRVKERARIIQQLMSAPAGAEPLARTKTACKQPSTLPESARTVPRFARMPIGYGGGSNGTRRQRR